jgi:pimeloyl-ACP methyl ester carboxylesterase
MSFLERDGAKLFYEDAGRDGDLAPLLLVHGWTCYHGHFAPQVSHFADRRRVVAVDLRGHGQSDGVGPFTIEGFADDLAWLSGALDLQRPVVVGHSMGGMIAVQLAASRPDVVRAAVALDSPFVQAGAMRPMLEDFIAALRGPEFRTALKGMIDTSMFGPHDEPVLVAEIAAFMAGASQEVAAGAFESIASWDGEGVLRSCTVPVMTVAASPGGWQDASPLLADCPHLTTGVTVGAGHFIQLFAADQVNGMLERFLAIVG